MMLMLGYDDMKVFKKVIDRAIKAFMSLNIDHYDNIIKTDNPTSNQPDFKLTRFACYLIAMNADPKSNRLLLRRHTLPLRQEGLKNILRTTRI